MDAIRLLLADARGWWAARSPVVRWSMLGGAIGVPGGLLVALIVLALGGGGDDAPVVVATPPPETATAAPSASATGPATTVTPVLGSIRAGAPSELADPLYGVGEIPQALETGPPTVGTLGELTELYGAPPDATLGRFRIPVLGVDAPLGQRFVSGSTMPTPTGPGDVVWYDLSQWDGLGGVPGARRQRDLLGPRRLLRAGGVGRCDLPWPGRVLRPRRALAPAISSRWSSAATSSATRCSGASRWRPDPRATGRRS